MISFPNLIKRKRERLGETKTKFGQRFKYSRSSVHGWEMGWSKAPYAVLSFVLEDLIKDNE